MAQIREYKYILGKSINTYISRGVYTSETGETIEDENWSQASGLDTKRYGSLFMLAQDLPCKEIYYRKGYADGSRSELIKVDESSLIEASEPERIVLYVVLVFYKLDSTFEDIVVYQAREAKPYYSELTVDRRKEQDQMFFRKELKGGLFFMGTDFEFISSASLDSRLCLAFYRSSSDEVYINAIFYKTDCSFDYTKKKCEPSNFTILDSYSELLEKYDNEYDLLRAKVPPAVTPINTKIRGVQQVYLRGDSQVTNFMDGIYWEEQVAQVQDSHKALRHDYHFGLTKVFMEITFENSLISGVNGVYTGEFSYNLEALEDETDYGDWYALKGNFTNSKGYRIEVGEPAGSLGSERPIYLKDPAGLVLYEGIYPSATLDIKPEYFLGPYGAWVPATPEAAGPEGNAYLQASSAFRYYLYKRVLCNVDSINGVKLYNLPSDDFATSRRNLTKCIGSELDAGISLLISNFTKTEPTRFGKNELGGYFTSGLPTTSGLQSLVCPLSRSSWANASLWFVFNYASPDSLAFDNLTMQNYKIRDTWSIDAVINAFLRLIAPRLKHEATAEYSQFLYGRAENNVLPEIAVFSIFIAPKSNVTHLNYDQPAQTAKLTFKKLMDMLRDCFQCYWYIEDNRLKIEHISYFKNGYTYDTTGQNAKVLDLRMKIDSFNKKFGLYAQNIQAFNKDELYRRYEFSGWMDEASFAFDYLNIDVQANYVDKNAKLTVSSSDFSSDIDLMYSGTTAFSDDGFALLCAEKNQAGEYNLPLVKAEITENEYTTMAYPQNWYASWLYLARLYMYDMPAQNIKADRITNLLVFDLKNFITSKVKIWLSEDQNLENKSVYTDLGLAQVESVSENIHTGLAEVELLYKVK